MAKIFEEVQKDPEEVQRTVILRKFSATEEKKSKESKFRINRETLPLKITLFLYYGGKVTFVLKAMASILPYVTIHMQAIGISITEVAIIYAVLPFTSFIGPPILGILADRFGNYKWILIIATFGCGLFNTLLLVVPQFQPALISKYPVFVKWDTNLESGILAPVETKRCSIFNNTALIVQNVTLNECQFYGDAQYNTSIESPSGISNDRIDLRDYEDSQCITIIRDRNLNVTLPNNLFSGNFLCLGEIQHLNPGYGNQQLTFWVYFLVRVVGTMFMGSCFSLLDATTLAVVKRCGKAEYGKERVWSIFGSAIMSPIAGILVDRISRTKEMTDYSPAFFLSNALLLCSIIAYFLIELVVDKPEKGVLKNAVKLFHYPEVVVFLVMIFILGSLWGFVESFLFIFLKELEAPNYLLGLTLTVGSLVGLPFLWGSEKIVAKVGRVNLIIAAFFTYFIRFFGYSYLRDPFWCFPFEALEAFTYHLLWVAAATYCSLLAPKGMLASMMGIMGSLHYSLGKGAGSFLGGISYGVAGARLAFRYFGIAAGVFGVVFYVLDLFWIRKVISKRVAENKEIEDGTGQEMQNMSKRGSICASNPLLGSIRIISLDRNEEAEVEDGVKETMLKGSK